MKSVRIITGAQKANIDQGYSNNPSDYAVFDLNEEHLANLITLRSVVKSAHLLYNEKPNISSRFRLTASDFIVDGFDSASTKTLWSHTPVNNYPLFVRIQDDSFSIITKVYGEPDYSTFPMRISELEKAFMNGDKVIVASNCAYDAAVEWYNIECSELIEDEGSKVKSRPLGGYRPSP